MCKCEYEMQSLAPLIYDLLQLRLWKGIYITKTFDLISLFLNKYILMDRIYPFKGRWFIVFSLKESILFSCSYWDETMFSLTITKINTQTVMEKSSDLSGILFLFLNNDQLYEGVDYVGQLFFCINQCTWN